MREHNVHALYCYASSSLAVSISTFRNECRFEGKTGHIESGFASKEDHSSDRMGFQKITVFPSNSISARHLNARRSPSLVSFQELGQLFFHWH
jgi:hypothetical protein